MNGRNSESTECGVWKTWELACMISYLWGFGMCKKALCTFSVPRLYLKTCQRLQNALDGVLIFVFLSLRLNPYALECSVRIRCEIPHATELTSPFDRERKARCPSVLAHSPFPSTPPFAVRSWSFDRRHHQRTKCRALSLLHALETKAGSGGFSSGFQMI